MELKHKIEIYVDKIYHEDKEITDAHEIADVICRVTKHLGSLSFYVTPKPKNKLQEWIRALSGK
jgi:hypothetical protein